MTNLVFSFDTEDFTSSYAADGILEAAELLRAENIRGCFCMVGLLARQLLAWGRYDVLEALKYHEIDFHTYGHTLHPTICEYTDTEDFAAAYAEVVRQESEGIALVKAATGAERVYTAVPPGDDKSYVAMYAYADMGLPCYADTFADLPDGRGVFFCNLLHFGYVRSWESIFGNRLGSDKAFFDQLAARKTAVLYNHPNRLRYDDFWDSVNYRHANHYPFGQWKEAPRTDLEKVKAFVAEIKTLVKNLKADGRFTFKTYAELAAERAGARIVTPEMLPAIREALTERFYPLTAPLSLSLSDVFSAALALLRGDKAFAAGRVYGFLDTPYAIDRTVTVSAADVRAAAAKINDQTFLPTQIAVGDTLLGPADFLFAMLDTLLGAETITLAPRPQNVDLAEFPLLAEPPITHWDVHVPGFDAKWHLKRLPLQAWTLRW
ncbi:MAG: hypothetical protein IKU55_04215 [Clostridia bacterium]|nr:hypothetical protein [Clostridia bacterium]